MRRPVTIMFHSVGLDRFRWSYTRISEPVDYFASKMSALKEAGYSTTFFVPRQPATTDDRQVALTFDDGYLDNWVHVFPILKQHGFTATVFVTPEFVDPRDIVRPQREPSVAANAHDAAGCCAGFLSWPELLEMERSGLVDVQSHGLTHDWYFKGPEIVDFWRPGAATEPGGPVWMLWNRFPELKPYYLTRAADLESEIPYGTPIYEHGKSLETRRYFPARGPDLELPKLVEDHGGPEFFERSDWREKLRAASERPRATREQGRWETEPEFLARVERELAESKSSLESRLGKTVEAFCWPGGGVTENVLRIARSVGYRRFTIPSRWRRGHAADRSDDMVARIASKSRIVWRGTDLGRPSPREFVWYVRSAHNPMLYRWVSRAITARRLSRHYLSLG